MALLRRNADLELAVFDGGILARGSTDAVAALATELERGPGRVRCPPQSVYDGLGSLAGVGGVASTQGTYFKMSTQSLKALREANGGRTPTGWIRGVVRQDGGSILKHLDLKKVKVNPQQALSMQTAAIGLALRTAIAEVLEAVERVEGKVDEVTRLIRSERLGSAMGDRRTLSRLVDRVNRAGSISETDWSSVAAMGPSIVRDIEALRAHVRLSLDQDIRPSTGSRLDAAERALDTARVGESLALLLIAEENHNMWQLLRLTHVRQTERSHLAATLEDARSAIAVDDESDQALVASLESLLTRLLEPGGTEGLALLQAPRLRAKASELAETLAWFSDQRLLEREAIPEAAWPGFRDSTQHVVRIAVTGAGDLADFLRESTRRKRQEPMTPKDPIESDQSRPTDDPATELGPPDS